ncbi:MAG: hypothetical protein LBE22_01680 [Azoarcus sp.]|nr:hypothetical protein [Azoarcus sp.]
MFIVTGVILLLAFAFSRLFRFLYSLFSRLFDLIARRGEDDDDDVWFYNPAGITIDAAGNFYVADSGNYRICKITPEGEVSTLVGNSKSKYAFADGTGSNALFYGPCGIVADKAGNLYVVDEYNHRIRKITPEGKVSTLAGGGEIGNEEGGFADGNASIARFSNPQGIAIDTAGNLYVADTYNHRIRKVTPDGVVSTLAGSDTVDHDMGGYTDGPGDVAQFCFPEDIEIDASGNLYVADTHNHRIRKITPEGVVSTLAGSGTVGHDMGGFVDGPASTARFYYPRGIASDTKGNLYVADGKNNCIRKITQEGIVSTLAGNGTAANADGSGSVARFNNPHGIAIDATGNLYVTDERNHLIRRVTQKGVVSTFDVRTQNFTDGQRTAPQFDEPRGIAIDAADNLYVVDRDNHRIRKVTPGGEISTLAGCGTAGDADGLGSVARFNHPFDIAIDASGNLYVADTRNYRIRRISPQGEVSTLAGNGTAGDTDGQGSAAQFLGPHGIAIDAAGNLYVTDFGGLFNNEDRCIRKVTPEGEVSTFNMYGDADGNSVPFSEPSGITVDAAGNLYVTDWLGECVNKVTPAGQVSTLAGDGESGFIDGQGRATRFHSPYGITIDKVGNLYVADEFNARIRKITPTGEVSTFAGGLDDHPAFTPFGIAIDAAGNLYVTDIYSNHCIRKISPQGEISTFVENGGDPDRTVFRPGCVEYR